MYTIMNIICILLQRDCAVFEQQASNLTCVFMAEQDMSMYFITLALLRTTGHGRNRVVGIGRAIARLGKWSHL